MFGLFDAFCHLGIWDFHVDPKLLGNGHTVMA